MLSVLEAQQRILALFSPIIETIPVVLEQAAGRILSADIFADTDLPPFDNSSVDGFAVRAADLASASTDDPRRLPVIGDIPAGSSPAFRLEPGQAARIMTGAPLPDGADAVVMVEDTDFNNRAAGLAAPETVALARAVRPGENVRARGMDLKNGSQVLSAGTRLRAQDIGMLAMLGSAQVPARRAPRVAVLSTGDEILPVDAPLSPGKIRDTNSYTLAALAAAAACEIIRLGVAADTPASVRQKLDAAFDAGADVILSSAGVSVGAFDYVREVVEANGALDFWKVNMRPGKPLAFGRYRDIPFFGLPGNPVSAFVGFLVFVEPALRRLNGLPTTARPRVRAVLAQALESDGRESYLRALLTFEHGKYVARLPRNQSSGNLFSLVEANALLIIPSGVKSCPPETELRRGSWRIEMDKKLYWASVIITVIGLAVSIYMTILKYWGGETMCVGNGGCVTVSESPYAMISGVPVAVVGIGGYLAILLVLVLEKKGGRIFKKNSVLLTFAMTLIGFFFTLYLIYLEIYVIKALCPFCLTSQVSMTILFILSVVRLAKQPVN